MRLRDLIPNKPVIHQSREIELRGKDDEAKTYTFTAATERAVDTPWGPEILRMAGCDMSRYERNPVLLDSHNRNEASAVLGRVHMRVEGTEMVAELEFADTDRARQARQLVDGGFLRAVSVGFIPRKIRTLRDGEVEDDAEGPCRIIHEWELIELSLVPVPADAEALARSHYFQPSVGKENPMQYPDTGTPQERAAETPSAPAPSPEGKVTKFEEIAGERQAREISARKAAILDICPRGQEALAERLILEGVSVDEARVRFLSAMQSQPVGTPEPAAPNPKPVEQTREVTADAFLRCLLSL